MTWSIRAATVDEMPEIIAIDDSATELYARAGIPIALSPAHPFAKDEQARWLQSAEAQSLFVAVGPEGQMLGFAALGRADGAPYLDQLSVRADAMRRGIGRELLRFAIAFAGRAEAQTRPEAEAWLWLTTYDHLPWNRAFYEGEGFVAVAEPACGPDIRHHLDEQRRVLPAPEHRMAMRRPLERPDRPRSPNA